MTEVAIPESRQKKGRGSKELSSVFYLLTSFQDTPFGKGWDTRGAVSLEIYMFIYDVIQFGALLLLFPILRLGRILSRNRSVNACIKFSQSLNALTCRVAPKNP